MEILITKRFKAFIIDVSILITTEILLIILFMLVVNKDFLFIYCMTGSITYALFFCKDIINGQSPGKRILKIQIVDDKNNLPSIRNLILRNIIALLQPIDLLYITTKGKRLGDVLCKTKVVSTLNSKVEYNHNIVHVVSNVIIVFFITAIFFYGMWLVSTKINS